MDNQESQPLFAYKQLVYGARYQASWLEKSRRLVGNGEAGELGIWRY